MCSHEGCTFRRFATVDSTHYCKFHSPDELGVCGVVQKNGEACGCPVRRSVKGVRTCLVHIPKSTQIEQCSICLEDTPVGTKPTVCGHYFHRGCMKEWKTHANGHTCPMCRHQISKLKQHAFPAADVIRQVTLLARDHDNPEDFMAAIVTHLNPQDLELVLEFLQTR